MAYLSINLMLHRAILLLTVSLSLFIGCKSGVRKFDFESKQFSATFNVDSTLGIDSMRLANLVDSKAIYSFGEDGKGVTHIQMGMVSKDTPFTWKLQGDSLLIDNKPYAVQKQEQWLMLKSDSAKIMLSKAP